MTARKRPAVVWLVEWRTEATGNVWTPFRDRTYHTRAEAAGECRYRRGGASGCEYRPAKYVREER